MSLAIFIGHIKPGFSDKDSFVIIITLCTRDTINYLTSETDTTRRGVWFKMESGELTIILILQAFMRGSLGHDKVYIPLFVCHQQYSKQHLLATETIVFSAENSTIVMKNDCIC